MNEVLVIMFRHHREVSSHLDSWIMVVYGIVMTGMGWNVGVFVTCCPQRLSGCAHRLRDVYD